MRRMCNKRGGIIVKSFENNAEAAKKCKAERQRKTGLFALEKKKYGSVILLKPFYLSEPIYY